MEEVFLTVLDSIGHEGIDYLFHGLRSKPKLLSCRVFRDQILLAKFFHDTLQPCAICCLKSELSVTKSEAGYEMLHSARHVCPGDWLTSFTLRAFGK
jgi:hypothetical protein